MVAKTNRRLGHGPRSANLGNGRNSANGLGNFTVRGALPAILLKAGKKKKIWRIREELLQRWIEQREAETKKMIQGDKQRNRPAGLSAMEAVR